MYLTRRSDLVLPSTQGTNCLRSSLGPAFLARNEGLEHAVEVLQAHAHLTQVPQQLRALGGADLRCLEEVSLLVDYGGSKQNKRKKEEKRERNNKNGEKGGGKVGLKIQNMLFTKLDSFRNDSHAQSNIGFGLASKNVLSGSTFFISSVFKYSFFHCPSHVPICLSSTILSFSSPSPLLTSSDATSRIHAHTVETRLCCNARQNNWCLCDVVSSIIIGVRTSPPFLLPLLHLPRLDKLFIFTSSPARSHSRWHSAGTCRA